jgi:hypothetical protein
MNPRTIDEYLEQLRAAMRDDDPALMQDALYDAEEYLRAELAQQPDRPAEQVLAEIVASYGAPEEVAAAYRETERTVAAALRAPARTQPPSFLGTVFGVFVDPRAYTAVMYMLLALATGILYFTVAVTGLSLSLGLAITLIGIPFFLLFLAFVRVLSLVEGRVVEVMLGVRMPRRPPYPARDTGFWARVGNMLTDARTWTTLLYMVLQLPLGILYFTIAVTGFSLSLGLLFAPLGLALGAEIFWFDGVWVPGTLLAWLSVPIGFAGLLAMMHLCRAIGHVHGGLAKYLLVRG